LKVWKCRASFYSANDDLVDMQTIEVKGNGLPCFKIPKDAEYVIIKVEEIENVEYSFDGKGWTFRSKEDALKHFKDEGFVEALIKAGYIKFSKQ